MVFRTKVVRKLIAAPVLLVADAPPPPLTRAQVASQQCKCTAAGTGPPAAGGYSGEGGVGGSDATCDIWHFSN